MRIALLLVVVALAQGAYAQKEPIEVAGDYEVDIQTSAICEMCKEAIEYDLTFRKGVKGAELNLENKVVTVKYNPKKIDADEIRAFITKVGYHADNMKRDSVAYENLPFCCKDGSPHMEGQSHK